MKIDLHKQIGAPKYPEKTSLNLLMNDKSKMDAKSQIALFVVFLLLLGAFVKFAVVDRLAEAYEAQRAYENMQAQITELRQLNERSKEIREKYSHYGYGYLSEEETAQVDRMEMLTLIQRAVISKSEIQAVDITQNVATITIDKIRLSTASQIVENLESSEKVDYVTVATAGTRTDEHSNVSATIMIYFKDAGGEK